MKTKFKLGLLAGGLVAGLASLVPLTTYATDTSVSVKVNKAITLDSVSTPATITADPTKIQTGNFSVKVITNSGYKIQLHAANTALSSSTTSETIPAGTPAAGQNKWAIKLSTAADTGYTALTTSAADFYTGASGTDANGVSTTFTVGVSVASTLTAANYSTTVTVTAVNQ